MSLEKQLNYENVEVSMPSLYRDASR